VKFTVFPLLGVVLLAFIMSMRRLAQYDPINYYDAVFYEMLIYVDVVGSMLVIIFLPSILGWSKDGSTIKVFYICIAVAGWVFLLLIASKTIFKTHDYSLLEVGASEGDEDRGANDQCRRALFQRGIDEHAFRYKYMPKVHLTYISSVWISMGTVVGGFIWVTSLAIAVPLFIISSVVIYKVLRVHSTHKVVATTLPVARISWLQPKVQLNDINCGPNEWYVYHLYL